MKLQIIVITYNRSQYLKRTLEYLSASVLNSFNIIVLDNCSTDNSVIIANGFKDLIPNLKVISNKFNIGGDGNIMRAIELSNGEYTWILCDDDILDLSDFDDVIDMLNTETVQLIHVGAHADDGWSNFGGRVDTPRNLWANRYPYFKFSSFLPCNIFKTQSFVSEYIIKGYENIGIHYPHMPFLIGQYENDHNIYISKHQIVTAHMGNQSYEATEWFYWWISLAKMLKRKTEVRAVFLDQWKSINNSSSATGLDSLEYILAIGYDKLFIKRFISDYFTYKDQIYWYKKRYGIKRVKNLVRKIIKKLNFLI